MVMDTVISRCAKESPVAVMARLALQRALEAAWIDELFEREAGTQYERELLFSTTVELMPVVAVGLRPSLHAAAQACPELPVSVQALYDKIKPTEPHLVRALVVGSAERLIDVLAPMIKDKAPMVPGCRLRTSMAIICGRAKNGSSHSAAFAVRPCRVTRLWSTIRI